jgi:murein DD-endopeptidase MepM/ murein hydrolase activator NlpD
MGTRSHPEYTGCVVNHSTAPSPASFAVELHYSGCAAPYLGQVRQHGTVLLPPPIASPSRLAVLAIVVSSMLLAASPAAMATEVHSAEGAAIRWHWPVDGPRMLVRPYLAPATPYGAGHRGIDVSGTSEVVYAPADGVVHFAGTVVDRPVLSIRHSGGLISSFEPVATSLLAGDSVRAGELVGTLQAGHCSAPCLHFGVRLHGEYVSPFVYLGGIPHSVLLPTRPLAS